MATQCVHNKSKVQALAIPTQELKNLFLEWLKQTNPDMEIYPKFLKNFFFLIEMLEQLKSKILLLKQSKCVPDAVRMVCVFGD